jgi:hypothetical protein
MKILMIEDEPKTTAYVKIILIRIDRGVSLVTTEQANDTGLEFQLLRERDS